MASNKLHNLLYRLYEIRNEIGSCLRQAQVKLDNLQSALNDGAINGVDASRAIDEVQELLERITE